LSIEGQTHSAHTLYAGSVQYWFWATDAQDHLNVRKTDLRNEESFRVRAGCVSEEQSHSSLTPQAAADGSNGIDNAGSNNMLGSTFSAAVNVVTGKSIDGALLDSGAREGRC
jgi:hypothetical protein